MRLGSRRKQKDAIAKRKEDAKARLVKVKEMREESKGLVRTLRERDELAKALADEYEKMPKEVKRSSYVNRILDIIKNVNKQKAEIDRILKDVQVHHLAHTHTRARTRTRTHAHTIQVCAPAV